MTPALAAAAATLLLLAQEPVAVTARFALHSDPWINLHHFLYQWSRADLGLGTGRREVRVPERESPTELPAAQREPWERAIRFYRDSVAPRHHFSPELVRLKADLLALRGDPAASPPDGIPGLGAALRDAMPVYLSRWWPQHDRANRAWIASVAPLLGTHEERFVELTTRTHGARWPDQPWRVDVSAYANPRAGYTTPDGHVVIFSTDPGNQELYGFETLLHEVQHARAIGDPLERALSAAFHRAGARVPGNLAHGMLFATAGEFAATVAAREGRPTHVPYWTREGFERLKGWGEVVPAVTRHWIPVVRGEARAEKGLEALASCAGGAGAAC